MNKTLSLILAFTCILWLIGCGESGDDHGHGDDDGTHTHADGTIHKDGHDDDDTNEEADHDHGEEQALPAATIGDITVQLVQAHGALQAGKEGHLIVKLPYNDKGETIVRAWIGTDDRTLSMVGKGEYTASHDDYDIHTMAPNPLPENTMWWIEIEKPDGSKAAGSAKPITE